jgi:aspartyl-tRNA(Asn)/glutamyl-tRNA(Gln) amidotransferase subunit C
MADASLNIDYVAQLARLALTDDEKRRFAQQLGDVLTYVEKLKQVDVTGVEPTAHAFEVVNVWQADVPAVPLPPDGPRADDRGAEGRRRCLSWQIPRDDRPAALPHRE